MVRRYRGLLLLPVMTDELRWLWMALSGSKWRGWGFGLDVVVRLSRVFLIGFLFLGFSLRLFG